MDECIVYASMHGTATDSSTARHGTPDHAQPKRPKKNGVPRDAILPSIKTRTYITFVSPIVFSITTSATTAIAINTTETAFTAGSKV